MKRRENKTSIKDIAREAGVAISTVSYVLNSSKFVTEETKSKVLAAIAKLDYKPNIIARSLRTKSTKAIGVIVPDITNPYFAQVIKGMEETARKRDYSLILGCTFYNKKEEELQMDTMMDKFVDGLIFFCGYDAPDHILRVYEKHVPVIAVDRVIEDERIPSVLIDNAAGMEKAVDYLCSLGHREIGYLTFGFESQKTVNQRYNGYLRSLRKNGIPVNPDFIIINENTRLNETEGTYEIVKKTFAGKKPPSAFAVLADAFAFGLIKALKELGYRVPQDVSVMGFGDDHLAGFMEPALSSLGMPKAGMGEAGMNLLLNIIEGKEIEEKRVILPTELILRESVAPPSDQTGRNHGV